MPCSTKDLFSQLSGNWCSLRRDMFLCFLVFQNNIPLCQLAVLQTISKSKPVHTFKVARWLRTGSSQASTTAAPSQYLCQIQERLRRSLRKSFEKIRKSLKKIKKIEIFAEFLFRLRRCTIQTLSTFCTDSGWPTLQRLQKGRTGRQQQNMGYKMIQTST